MISTTPPISDSARMTVPMMPRMNPACAMPRPPSWPPEASISLTAPRPITSANGATMLQATMPRMPRIKARVERGWSGATVP